jgi:hypothetical protein
MSIPIFTAMSINMDTNIMSIPPSIHMPRCTAMSTNMRRWSICMSILTCTPTSTCTSILTSTLMQKTSMCMTMNIPGSMAAMSMSIRRMRRKSMIILIEGEAPDFKIIAHK